MASRDVDDAQTPHADGDTWLGQHTFVVRSSMTDDATHLVDEGARGLPAKRRVDIGRVNESGNSAHRPYVPANTTCGIRCGASNSSAFSPSRWTREPSSKMTLPNWPSRSRQNSTRASVSNAPNLRRPLALSANIT